MLNAILAFVWSHVALTVSAVLALYLLRNKFWNGLHKYPGPFAASFTSWWRFWDVYKGSHQLTQVRLHRQYGPIVRLGPNVISFSSPNAIKEIYGLGKGYTKTEFYPVQQNVSQGRRIPSLFSTTDEDYHAVFRRHVNSAFAMSTLVGYEPLVDETISVFLRRTRELFCAGEKAQLGKECDFARWLQFFAFDVIGQISFSKRLGFLENNEDVDGIVASIAGILRYSAIVGQQPWLDRYVLNKNPLKMWMMRQGWIGGSNPVARFAAARNAERRSELGSSKDMQDGVIPEIEGKGVDFLTRFLAEQRKDPDFMTDTRVLIATTSLINAGSDTTAISLSSVFYHLGKHPQCYEKLMAELHKAVSDGTIVFKEGGEGIVSWSDAQKLPYLDAVIQESFRLFPAAGLLLERHVPPSGAVICGEHIRGGTIVGCNAWVVHRDSATFGADVDAFRPERWTEAKGDQLKRMQATMLQFGAGSRTCIGKNISLLEVYKLVPSFLLNFEVHQVGKGEWKTMNAWFVRQLDFMVRFKEKEGVF